MNRSITRMVLIAAAVLLPYASPFAGGNPQDADVRGSEAAPTTGGAISVLTGTVWRLVSFQSMDDAVGEIRPKDPSVFTMELNRDGTVVFHLDCNRARGTWSAEPVGNGSSGGFTFGVLAATRALCLPPHLDERITTDADFIRGFLLREGRLYLSLMADGGIYAWEPLQAPIPIETTPDAKLEAAILQATPDYTLETVQNTGREARYLYGRVDLNEDGEQEVFVYLLGPIFCGTGGCNLLLFSADGEGYSLVNTFPISRLPLIVSPEKTMGWSDLIRLESGGGMPPSYVRHTYDGSGYVKQNRLPADSQPKGTKVLTGGFVFQDGIPLQPSN